MDIKEQFEQEFTRLVYNLKAINERWITIHPHGEDSEDYRRLKIEDGETPKEAIERVFKKNDKKQKSKEDLIKEQRQIFQDILKAKKEGNTQKARELKKRYYEIEEELKGNKSAERKDKNKDNGLSNIQEQINYFKNLDINKLNFDDLKKEEEKLSEFLLKNGNIQDRRTLQNILSQIESKRKQSNQIIAGVKKGNPMDRNKADNGNPNPNYLKKQGCTTNCQTCVVAYEARLRGYDVQALGNYKNSTIKELSHRTNLAWINPETGKHPDYITDLSVKNYKSCYSWLDSEIKKGNRYTLEFGWKGRRHSGHIVSIDKDENNNLRLYDPQNGKTITDKKELYGYFQRFKYQFSTYGLKIPDPPKLLRIDNMDFNVDIVDKILEKSN